MNNHFKLIALSIGIVGLSTGITAYEIEVDYYYSDRETEPGYYSEIEDINTRMSGRCADSSECGSGICSALGSCEGQ